MKRMLCAILLVLVTHATIIPSASAGEVSITAASDLQYAMKEIIASFEARNHGDKVKAVFGSSGKAFAQIAGGAPYDIYFAADIEYPQRLRREGFAVTEPKPYAIGRIALWVTNRSRLDVAKGIDLLLAPSVKKIAIANPDHAPYGRIAREVLQHFKIYDQVKNKLVLGENVQQAAQFVKSGAADAGLVAYSLALAPLLAKDGRYLLIPAGAHREIIQGYVLLKPSVNNPVARKFEAFVGSNEARSIFRKYGFSLPNE